MGVADKEREDMMRLSLKLGSCSVVAVNRWQGVGSPLACHGRMYLSLF